MIIDSRLLREGALEYERTSERTSGRPPGYGRSRLRKEDARFIQGKGNYVDDIKMPGMLHMDIVRSPLAHARIKKINKEAALAFPASMRC